MSWYDTILQPRKMGDPWLMTTILVCLLVIGLEGKRKSEYDGVPEFTAEPKSQIVKDGVKVLLQCQANPNTAHVQWTVNGTDIANVAPILNIKTVREGLLIPAYRSTGAVSHAGTYRCTARTDMGRIISTPAQLQTAFLGEVKEMGDSIVAAVIGNVAVIPCVIPTSLPAPTNWFEFNGTTINKNTKKYHLLPSGNLHIGSVTSQDVGEYRCIVFNSVSGQLQTYNSTVTLQVLKPVAITPPKRLLPQTKEASYYGKLGDDMTLECVMSGNPPPVITWEVYGGQLPQGRSKQVLGNLELRNLGLADQGTYICRGNNNNSVGQPANVRFYIEIPDEVRISDKPKDQTVTEGEPAQFKCRIEGLTGALGRPRVIWTHNTRRLTRGGNYKIRGSSLLIRHTRLDHNGIYQCHIRHVKASAALIVLPKPTQSTTIPTDELVAPSKPRAMQVTSHNVLLKWALSLTSNVKVMYQKVQYRHKKWVTVDVKIPATTRMYEVEGLEIGRRYRFRIVAYYENSVQKVGPRSMRLRMRRPSNDSPITQMSHATTLEPPPADKQSTRMTICTTSSVTPPTNHRGGKNRHKIVKNRGKLGRGKRINLVPPNKPTVEKLSDTSVLVKWSVQPNNGLPISIFRVQYKRVMKGKQNGGKPVWKTVDEDIEKDQNKFEVTGLKSGATYKFKIAAIYSNNDNRASPSSDKFHLKVERLTNSYPPEDDPVIVRVRPVTASSMLIKWQYLHADKFLIEGYYIHYKPFHNNVPFTRITVLGDVKNQFVVKDLQPDVDYTFKMQVFNSAGPSQFSNRVTQRTLKGPGGLGGISANIPPFTPFRPPVNTQQPDGVLYNGTRTVAPPGEENDGPSSRSSTQHSNETLYMILGIVLGLMMLMLVIFMVMCGWKQRQQRRMLGIDASVRTKYMDPSQGIHRDTLRTKHTNGFLLNGVHSNGHVGNGHMSNGHLPNGHAASNMNININPMTEMPEQNTENDVSKYSDTHDSNAELSAYEQAPTLRSFQSPQQQQQYHSVDRNRNSSKDNLQFIEHSNTLDRDHSVERINYNNPPEYNSLNGPSHDKVPRSHDHSGSAYQHMPRVNEQNRVNESQGSSRHKRRRKCSHQREPHTFMKDQATNTDLSSNEGTIDSQNMSYPNNQLPNNSDMPPQTRSSPLGTDCRTVSNHSISRPEGE